MSYYLQMDRKTYDGESEKVVTCTGISEAIVLKFLTLYASQVMKLRFIKRCIMSYKIVDYEGETVADDFATATDAYTCMNKLFTKEHIKNMGLRIVRTEDNDE